MEYNKKVGDFRNILYEMDKEIKAWDNLIIKLSWSKGEIKEEVTTKDKIIAEINKTIEDH